MKTMLYRCVALALSFLLLLTAGCAALPSALTALPAYSSGETLVTTPISSHGCGKPAPVRPGTDALETVVSGGLTRSYLLYLPPDYRSTSSYALVLNFHGHNSNAFAQAYISGFTALAREQDFIVAYPQGLRGPDGKTGWATGLPLRAPVNDVLFVSDLLSHLQATLCINPQRIYATGFSNGGGMTDLLACKLARRIAAFASVSGSYPPVLGGCDAQRAVPIMEFHGTADSIVPYKGNPLKGEPPIPLWLHQWALRDDCTKGPLTFYRSRRVIGQEWTDCKGDAVVIGYRILGEGHRWPVILFDVRTGKGVYPGTASDLIWSFFQSHSLGGPKVAVK
jgi:polyhydroxybutyrate depolymerase